MKTILKLRKGEAAIVFRQDGIQLVQPETPQEMEVPVLGWILRRIDEVEQI